MSLIRNFRYLILGIFLLLSNTIFSQNHNIEDVFVVNKNQQNIDVEPFNIGYSLAFRVSHNSMVGFGLNFGLGIHFFLNSPRYLEFNDGVCDSSGCYYNSQKNFLTPTFELLKLQSFYRYYIRNNAYFELGCYISKGNLPTNYEKSGFVLTNTNIGGSLSIFYGSERLKFGQRIQVGNIHINYPDNGVTTNISSILLSPIVIQFVLGK